MHTPLYEKAVIQIIDGKNKTKNNITEIERARIILRTLGVKVAARYLAVRNWTLDAALFVLFGVGQRYEVA